MPLRRVAVSHVLAHGFLPPLNPSIENTTSTLRTDTDSNESGDLAYKTRVVISAAKPNTYIHTPLLESSNRILGGYKFDLTLQIEIDVFNTESHAVIQTSLSNGSVLKGSFTRNISNLFDTILQ